MTEQRIGPYVIERRLGVGGMAEVFLARKQVGAAWKRVVVKRMLPDLNDDPKFVQMFEREAVILAQLNHANVVQIFDLGSDKGKLYIAMEWLDGVTVHDLAVRTWKARRALPTELVLRVVADAARGLDYVHKQADADGAPLHLIHRDVAPDNLFFVKDGTIKLLDFGVARSAAMKQLTQRGELKGKVPFMAPEQLESRPLDGRTDLYSLGVSAYWLLTGQRPFRAPNDLGLIRAILRTEPAPIRSINADVPAWLATTIERLLAKDPADRVQSGAELETLITKRAGQHLDRARDVAFMEEVLGVRDLDDNTSPHPALRRNPTGVFARAAPKPVSMLEVEPVDDAMIEGEADLAFEMATTLHDEREQPTFSATPQGTKLPAPARTPMPRAAKMEMPIEADDPSNDTLRLTESQLGLRDRSSSDRKRR